MNEPTFRRYQASDLEKVQGPSHCTGSLNGSYIGTGPWEKDLDTIEEHICWEVTFVRTLVKKTFCGHGAIKRIDDSTAKSSGCGQTTIFGEGDMVERCWNGEGVLVARFSPVV